MTQKSRRLPKQARSRKRYDHMLNTAADLFARQGVSQVTTNHIAAEAGVSIGSLYQFFPNKEAVIEALIERYVDEMGKIFPEAIDTQVPIQEVIRGVITKVVEFREEKDGFESILVGLEGTRNAKAAEGMHYLIVSKISWVLGVYYPQLEVERRNLCAAVSFSIVGGMLPSRMPDAIMIEETVLAVNAYQRAFLNRELDR
ncbi:MAG: TetR/AcrR family transcriptional regulator [Chloroflexota bacterium]